MTLGKLHDPICVHLLFCIYLCHRVHYSLSLWTIHASVTFRLGIQDSFLNLLIFAIPSSGKKLTQNRWSIMVCGLKCRVVVKVKMTEFFLKCRGLYHCRLLKITIRELSCNERNEKFDTSYRSTLCFNPLEFIRVTYWSVLCCVSIGRSLHEF